MKIYTDVFLLLSGSATAASTSSRRRTTTSWRSGWAPSTRAPVAPARRAAPPGPRPCPPRGATGRRRREDSSRWRAKSKRATIFFYVGKTLLRNDKEKRTLSLSPYHFPKTQSSPSELVDKRWCFFPCFFSSFCFTFERRAQAAWDFICGKIKPRKRPIFPDLSGKNKQFRALFLIWLSTGVGLSLSFLFSYFCSNCYMHPSKCLVVKGTFSPIALEQRKEV